MAMGPERTSPRELSREVPLDAFSMPAALAEAEEEQSRWRERLRRRGPLVAVLVLLGIIVAALAWWGLSAPSPVSNVRYVNDTLTAVVVQPCGSATRCVLPPGAEVTQPPREDGSGARVYDARTHRLRGCIAYAVGDREVLVSDADYGAPC